MNLETINTIAFENMAKRRANLQREVGYIYYHGLRAATLSGEISHRVFGAHAEFDKILHIGALFHDVGKGFQPHNEVGAQITRKLLADYCAPEELVDIEQIVRFHCVRKRGIQLSDRVLCVQDADILDHFGTQEIWLQIFYSAATDQSQTQALEYWNSDEFTTHLDELRELINFDVTRRLFESRLAFARGFVDRFGYEAEGRLFPETGD